ncbi:cell division protein FtsQ/DivIB [Ectobacillus sp. sgz5001026]|uniref:cell division protein FtsQ/DivIB n=1 Tax=Ectobacillus sp. sgz5001026 TaxID=3242473 RepID=UPI0036D28CF2
MDKKVIQLEDRVPKLKLQKRKKMNRRLVLYLSILFMLVMFGIYFRSPISKIADISVEGNHYLNKNDVMALSGVTYDMSYFRINASQSEEKLRQQTEIKNAVVKKLFPNKIAIVIEEYKTTGYVKKDNTLYPILENGKSIGALKGNTLPVAAPLFIDFKDENTIQQLSKELAKLDSSIVRSISEIHFSPNSTDPNYLLLFMDQGYVVSVTVQDFATKMGAYPLIIKQLKPGDKVQIHLEVGAYIEHIN